MNKTENIFNLLNMLKDNPLGLTDIIKEFKSRHKISLSRETIYRYLRVLQDLGYKISLINKKYEISVTNLSSDCVRKLFDRNPTVFNNNLISRIKEGIRHQLEAVVVYKSPRYEKEIKLNVDLLDIVSIKNKIYMLARDCEDKTIKEFRLDRIAEIKLNADKKITDRKNLPIKFIVKKELAQTFYSPFVNSTGKKLKNGDLEFEAEVHSYFRAKKILAEYLDQVVVTGPAEFKKEFVQTLDKMRGNYR
ncbi:MAG: WYL domain-containing transcriptional regulator [Candidatus Margulisbacteria bacterium]|nr:WYL domain-containing transcriptional regulator [Candidatus Margulisiibacteriota bacterium]